ncbi:hypothetical protein LAZ67_8002357 [Cordylochernes scorpioides]|uniref:Uncharacterized protein n=1 Tax=Cordylochernes scorpioides TaxID=51811 RepID=A0ABY6KUI9_9ARAC|nr:hypothetical protein LAZ67_8002357 [Cordylochernes scorpioides]
MSSKSKGSCLVARNKSRNPGYGKNLREMHRESTSKARTLRFVALTRKQRHLAKEICPSPTPPPSGCRPVGWTFQVPTDQSEGSRAPSRPAAGQSQSE